MTPDKGSFQSIDQALKEAGPEAILARLSNELDTSIQLGDGTIYEDGDRHEPEDMSEPDSAQDWDPNEEAPQ